MIRFSRQANEQEILDVVRLWVSKLATNDYEGAFAMTYHGPDESWTPDLMRELIAGYDSYAEGDISLVTPLETATLPPDWLTGPSHTIAWFDANNKRNPPPVGQVWFDLPVNGEWSDLTALFWVCIFQDGFVLELDDIHVM